MEMQKTYWTNNKTGGMCSFLIFTCKYSSFYYFIILPWLLCLREWLMSWILKTVLLTVCCYDCFLCVPAAKSQDKADEWGADVWQQAHHTSQTSHAAKQHPIQDTQIQKGEHYCSCQTTELFLKWTWIFNPLYAGIQNGQLENVFCIHLSDHF